MATKGRKTSSKRKTNKPKVEDVRKAEEFREEITLWCIIAVSALCLRYVVLNTRSINVLKNSYKVELNRILKSCDEKIVKLNKKLDVEGKEIIEVKDFGELIKLSEELFKPILYWNNSEKEEAEFFILIDNLIYRYELKVN